MVLLRWAQTRWHVTVEVASKDVRVEEVAVEPSTLVLRLSSDDAQQTLRLPLFEGVAHADQPATPKIVAGGAALICLTKLDPTLWWPRLLDPTGAAPDVNVQTDWTRWVLDDDDDDDGAGWHDFMTQHPAFEGGDQEVNPYGDEEDEEKYEDEDGDDEDEDDEDGEDEDEDGDGDDEGEGEEDADAGAATDEAAAAAEDADAGADAGADADADADAEV